MSLRDEKLSPAGFVGARDNQAGDFFWRLAYLFS
jgi:hypothetical protein